EAVLKELKENPHAELACVFKNDGGGNCECPRCKALRDAEGSDMACQLFMINQVAEAVEKEFPRVSVDTLAYLDTIGVPKTVRPRKNVVIRLCNDTVGAWTHPFTPAEQCDVAKLAEGWSKACGRIYIWDYNVNFSHYLAPMPNLDVMAANIRFWIKNHAEGVMLQGGYQGPAERDQLKSWVSAKLLWNPAWDEKALTRDFIEGHYGQAAPALEEYEALLQRLRTEHAKDFAAPPGGIRYPMDAPFLTSTFVNQATAIFAQARALAGGDDELLRRVERAELPILYVQCARGPAFVGNSYAQVVAEFERIARREKIQYLEEGSTDFERKLAGYKALIPKAAPAH
ncbi:MAG TPA: DUF4838 domain-containing protein, partial [Candidatus Acidoferrum sp.]|nr:DUF4838 domain-containing protein [Candidatus Acidoferrum sp.]